nr:HNH endonuclease [Halovenus salina]
MKKRDGYTCQNCGANGGPKSNNELHCHHIVPISDGGSHKKSNLKTLCKDCHDAIHHNDKVAPTGKMQTDNNPDLPLPSSVDLESVGKTSLKYYYLLLIKYPILLVIAITKWTWVGTKMVWRLIRRIL